MQVNSPVLGRPALSTTPLQPRRRNHDVEAQSKRSNPSDRSVRPASKESWRSLRESFEDVVKAGRRGEEATRSSFSATRRRKDMLQGHGLPWWCLCQSVCASASLTSALTRLISPRSQPHSQLHMQPHSQPHASATRFAHAVSCCCSSGLLAALSRPSPNSPSVRASSRCLALWC